LSLATTRDVAARRCVWRCLTSSAVGEGGPSSRIGHSAIAIGRSIVIVGGRNFHQNEFRQGVSIYDTVSNTWMTPNVQCETCKMRSISGSCSHVGMRTGQCAVATTSGKAVVLAPRHDLFFSSLQLRARSCRCQHQCTRYQFP
jgi:Kelch motif